MQKPQKSAPETESERDGRLRLKGKGRVVELELFKRVAQVGIFCAVLREDAGKDHRQHLAVARQRFGRGIGGVRDGIADRRIAHRFDRRGDISDLAGKQLAARDKAGRAHHAAFHNVEFRAGGHHADAHSRAHDAVFDTDIDDNAAVGVIVAVKDERLKRRVLVAARRGDIRYDALEHRMDVFARFGRDARRVHARNTNNVLDLLRDALRLGGRQVDFVDDGRDLKVVLDRKIRIGKRLRLDALRRVDNQNRALARGKRTRHLVVEIDVAGGVDQIELIFLAVVGAVGQRHGARLDGDAAFALDVHIVENLVLHIAL